MSSSPQAAQPRSLSDHWAHWRARLHPHRPALALIAGYAATRLLLSAFAQMTFAPYGPGSSQFLAQGRLAANGLYPFSDYWSEYPPLFPWLAVGAYRLALLLPPWGDFWFATLLRLAVAPFDIGSLALVYALGLRLGEARRALIAAALYAVAFVTLWTPLGWFDALPTFWLLLAIYLLVRNRAVGTGLAVGLGLLTKPIIALALPAAWQRLASRGQRVRLLVATVLSAAASWLPLVLLNPQMALAHWRNVLSRPSWESVWALLDGYTGSGVVAPLAARFDVSSASWQNHAGGGYGLWVTLAFVLLGLYLWTRPIDWRDERRTVAFVGLTWALFSLWSKGYSPQWALAWTPFIVLLLPDLRAAAYLGLLALGLVAEWPVAFTLVDGQRWFVVAVIWWRTALQLLLTAELGLAALGRAGACCRRGVRVARRALLLGLLASAVVLGAAMLRGYAADRLVNEPLRVAIETLQRETSPESGLVCGNVEICERIAPYTRGLDRHWLPTPGDSLEAVGDEALASFVRRHGDLWLLTEGTASERASTLATYGAPVSQQQLGQAQLTRRAAVDWPAPQIIGVTFGGALHLESAAVAVNGRSVGVRLAWRAIAPLATPHKVYVHLIDGAGALVAQHDGWPAAGARPTDGWGLGEAVSDSHGLILPGAWRADYRLLVGWYDPETGARLAVDGAGVDSWELAGP